MPSPLYSWYVKNINKYVRARVCLFEHFAAVLYHDALCAVGGGASLQVVGCTALDSGLLALDILDCGGLEVKFVEAFGKAQGLHVLLEDVALVGVDAVGERKGDAGLAWLDGDGVEGLALEAGLLKQGALHDAFLLGEGLRG